MPKRSERAPNVILPTPLKTDNIESAKTY